MRSYIFPLLATFTGIAAIFYTACNDSKAENNQPGAPARQMEQAYGEVAGTFRQLQNLHQELVSQHASVMGKNNDSAHLHTEQLHLRLIEEDQQTLDKHKMTMQHLPADSSGARKFLEELHIANARMQSDLKKIQDDHAEMSQAHKQMN